jgi:hypothetical protein
MKDIPRAVVTCVACAIVVAIAVPVLADAPADVVSQVKNAYMNQCALIKSSDFATYSTTMTNDYVQVNADGKKATRDDTVAAIKTVVTQTGLLLTSCDVKVVSSERSGEDVTVTVTLTQKGSIPRAKGMAALEDATRERDVWTQVDGKWLQKSETVLGELTKLDGEIVQQTGTYNQ